MKNKLPLPDTKTTTLFPSFFRFITEYTFSPARSRNIKILAVSCISLYLVGLIFLQGVVYWHQKQHRDFLVQERGQLQKELQYWKGVADKYQGYRDVYFRIAAIQYKLGNISAAQQYLKKAFDLDPNFPEGHVLGAKIGLEKLF